ncbi:MAG: 1-deoxy-D-xylulose-5-phosphate reductoisomerase [Acidobacteriota bacterium]|jgi:1-deoxy-D-xylulose-5-phosphate reductoisomerase|nr:1-deoxy-D-xylulose-5-phosphate reductoisomerase [Acidobacteriota bacterium]
MKVISVLGSTGSIGTNTLKLVAEFPKDFRIAGLAAGRNAALLAEQVEQVRPQIVSGGDEKVSAEVQSLLRQRGYPMASTRFTHGVEGHVATACHPDAEIVLSAISGAAGLLPTYHALESGKSIALANKETMVMAGELMMRKSQEKNLPILPVDSEHNAIHQCLRGGAKNEVRRLILTASGGPFRNTPKEQFASITLAQALKHPTWTMGRKITIDSATLMNKGLEVIEAARLFGVTAEEISVVVHPQSVVHSMVEYLDGSVLAQLGVTDMRLPIQYALTWPERWTTPLPTLDIYKLPTLEFFEPDMEKFPCLGLAYKALRAGGTAPAVLNAANEIAVEAFLAEKLGFTDIPRIIAAVLDAHTPEAADELEVILKADAWARKEARKM